MIDIYELYANVAGVKVDWIVEVEETKDDIKVDWAEKV